MQYYAIIRWGNQLNSDGIFPFLSNIKSKLKKWDAKLISFWLRISCKAQMDGLRWKMMTHARCNAKGNTVVSRVWPCNNYNQSFSYQFLWTRCITLKPSNVYLYIISSNINELIELCKSVCKAIRANRRSPANKDCVSGWKSFMGWYYTHTNSNTILMKKIVKVKLCFQEEFEFKIPRFLLSVHKNSWIKR